MKRPFVFIGSAMFISLIIYSYLGIDAAAAVFAVSAILTLPLFMLRNKRKIFKAVFLCVAALLVSSTIFTTKTVTEYIPASMLCTDDECTVSGILTEYNNDYGEHYYTLKNISVNGLQTKQKIRINSKYYVSAEIDDKLTFNVMSVNSLNNINTSMHYKANGIYLRAYSQSAVTHVEAEKHSLEYYLNSIKRNISKSLSDNLHDGYAQAANAMLTGDKTGLDEDIQLNFSYSGISHLFAVSGFHLTLWTSAIYLFFKRFFGKQNTVGIVFSLAFIIFFMALTGFTQSVVRAGIMQIILLAGKLSKHKADSLNSLFIALTIILTANPFAAMSISLQMSFLSTLGIITLIEPISATIKILKNKIKSKHLYSFTASLYTTIAISIVATVFTVPVSAFNFGYYSIASPLTNLLCLPFAQLVIPLSSIGIAFSWFSPIASPVNILCNLIMKYIFFVTDKIAHFSWAVVDTQSAEMQIIVFIITFAIIILLPVFEGKSKQLRRCIAVCAASLIIVSAAAEISMANTHKITVANVGNGTSIVYQAGNKNIMIGCGGSKYKDFILSNISRKINTRTFELLLIPRNKDTEALYAYNMLKTHSYNNCIVSDEKYSLNVENLLPENTIRTSESNIKIDENTNIVYINNNNFSGARITAKNFDCTILFRPVADFSYVPADWLTGNLLITRQKVPDTELSGFENIFISTNTDIIYDNENVYSTAVDGSLTYRTIPWGGARIYADQ